MSQVCLYNCSQNSFETSEVFPFFIGTDPDVDCRLDGLGIEGKHCQITNDGRITVSALLPGKLEINGNPVQTITLDEDVPYPMLIGATCFFVVSTKDAQQWGESATQWTWLAFNGDQEISASMRLPQLLQTFQGDAESGNISLKPTGFHQGFPLDILSQSKHGNSVVNSPAMSTNSGPAMSGASGPKNQGAYTCPWCWWKFEAEDVKWVANHPALKGDPLLGADSYLRFLPNRFTGLKALDAKGNECSEIACPHCHFVIPMTMLRVPQHLISLVGDAQSGKSYLMTVMTKMLTDSLATYYDGYYEDATPGINAAIRDMIRTMFSASNINEGLFLQKTKLEGEMYHRLKRNGEDRMVLLPKPFIFHVSSGRSKGMNLVYYDNAGEHFQPGMDSSENPAAQHVASASGILFLFDPFNNIDFRRAMKCQRNDDPQFDQKVTGDVMAIMSEMKNRIQKITGESRLKAPLAFIVGKYDAWGGSLLPEGKQFFESKTLGGLNAHAIQHNSDLTREILMQHCPGVAKMAESLSDTVTFFPVSSFGSPAHRVEFPDGTKMNIPDPEQLNPFLVDAPILWLISRFDPALVPCN